MPDAGPELPAGVNNRNLFSSHFLAQRAPMDPSWQTAGQGTVVTEIMALFAQPKRFENLNEAQLEEILIRPLLKILGWAYEVQEAVPKGLDVPDYALFAQSEEFDRARQSGSLYSACTCIGEAKKWDLPLDKVGRDRHDKRRNPSFQIWLYLHETSVSWGILTNGRRWRLYHHDSPLDAYYEVDLLSLLRRGQQEDLAFFLNFFSAGAFMESPGQSTSFLERVLTGSEEYAAAVGLKLKDNVYRALRILANGFFQVQKNGLDKESSEDRELVRQNSLRLLYRILFLLYAEGKGLLSDRTYLASQYSMRSLKRDVAAKIDAKETVLPHVSAYWHRFSDLCELIDRGSEAVGIPANEFFVAPYNGGLFDPGRNPFLKSKRLGDAAFARALDLVSRTTDDNGARVYADFTTLDVKHLGGIYEGLLEYSLDLAKSDMVAFGEKLVWTPYAEYASGRKRPKPYEAFKPDDRAVSGEVYLRTTSGERKATGSYYTPQIIVDYIIDHTVRPALEYHQNKAALEGTSSREAVLRTKVVDPSMGSGHFLVGALEYLSKKLVQAIARDYATGHIEPTSFEDYTVEDAKRDVVRHCLYGVDRNEMALELAKLSLWLKSAAENHPLSFLDHRLKHGDSLIGAWMEDLLWLPGKRPKKSAGQLDKPLGFIKTLRDMLQTLVDLPEETPNDVKSKEQEYQRLLDSPEYQRIYLLANVHAGLDLGAPGGTDRSKHYHDLVQECYYGDSIKWKEYEKRHWVKDAVEASLSRHAFHWDLEYPDIFHGSEGQRGFSAVVGNPPYINAIQETKTGDKLSRDRVRKTFSTASGAFDIFIPFLELGWKIAAPGRRSGMITPNKFTAAPYGKALRETAAKEQTLVRFLDATRANLFDDPSVYPVVTIFQKSAPSDGLTILLDRMRDKTGPVELMTEVPHGNLDRFPECLWSFLISGDPAEVLNTLSKCVSLQPNVARVQASSTAEESDIMKKVVREGTSAESFQVVNTGTIDRYLLQWGRERLTHGGKKFLRPIIEPDSPHLSASRRSDYSKPKLIVAKLSLRPEIALDGEGRYAGLNVNFILDSKVDLYALMAILNSRFMADMYTTLFGGLTMQGEYQQVQAPQLRALPIPRHLVPASASLTLEDFGAEAGSGPTENEGLVKEMADRAKTLEEISTSKAEIIHTYSSWACSPAGAGISVEAREGLAAIVESVTPGPESPTVEDVELYLKRRGISLSPKKLSEFRKESEDVIACLREISAQLSAIDQEVEELVRRAYGVERESQEPVQVKSVPLENFEPSS